MADGGESSDGEAEDAGSAAEPVGRGACGTALLLALGMAVLAALVGALAAVGCQTGKFWRRWAQTGAALAFHPTPLCVV
jgi:hypothetical protein